MNDAFAFYRADGLLDLETVGSKKILLIGAGSLGSKVIENLAYPWGMTVVADPDLLKIENVERHLLSRRFVGSSKVDGVKQWLVERGVPESRILAYAGPVEDILSDHTDADLAIVSVDDRQAKMSVDRWARANGVPMLIGGVYHKGNGGHYVYLPEPKEVCYGCVAHMLGEDAYVGKTSNNYDVDVTQLLNEQGNLVKVPSLLAPVAAIAASMAILALKHLEGGEIQPHILYQAFGWENVLTLRAGSPELLAVTGYMLMHKQLGILPHMRLVSTNKGRELDLYIQNGSLPITIERWADCPNHDFSSNSLEEI